MNQFHFGGGGGEGKEIKAAQKHSHVLKSVKFFFLNEYKLRSVFQRKGVSLGMRVQCV